MRHILHPGPTDGPRLRAQPCQLRSERLSLPPGRSLLTALAEARQRAGADSAVLRLQGGEFAPLAWVLPHTARTPEHAVYFSPRHDSPGPARLLSGCVTLGRREGQPWLHCHAEWQDADGRRHLGHLLPDDSLITGALSAEVHWLHGAAFEVGPDAETRFSLFQPVATATAAAPEAPRAWAVRLAPNVDVAGALVDFCRAQGLARARVRGGVGSTVGVAFDDGRVVEPHITECFIEHGRVGADGLAELDIALVDHHGGQHRGRLAPGANPVLVTMELVLESIDAP